MSSGGALASPGIAGREETHRRRTLLGIAMLLVLSTLPVVGHHVASGFPIGIGSVDHLGAMCMVALRGLLAPVHWWFHLLIGAGLLYAIIDRWKGWIRVREALGLLDTRHPEPGDEFWTACAAAGLDVNRVMVVKGLPNPAFTAGMWSPRVFVAEDIANRLQPHELECVLAHESAHLRRRDPLRLSVYRFLGCALFWIPALKRLAEDMGDEIEVLADDVAGEGRPLVMASAILALADAGYGPDAYRAVWFNHPDLLERRVRRLAGESIAPATHLTGRSFIGAALALALVLASGAAAAQSDRLGSSGHLESHCNHPEGSLVSHLFCSGCHSGRPSHCSHKV